MVSHASSAAGPLHSAGGEAATLLVQISAGLRALQDNTTGLLRDVADHTLALVDDLAACLARGALRPEKPAEEVA